jgi:hypothetical protein
MRAALRSSRSRFATSWLLVLAIVFGAFAPGWHALASAAGEFDPSRELCSVYGIGLKAPADPAPASGATPGPSHCTACPASLLAGLLPTDAVVPVVASATAPVAPSGSAPAPESAPNRWAAPRGPPALA